MESCRLLEGDNFIVPPCIYIYIYIYVCVCVCNLHVALQARISGTLIYIYIYIYIYNLHYFIFLSWFFFFPAFFLYLNLFFLSCFLCFLLSFNGLLKFTSAHQVEQELTNRAWSSEYYTYCRNPQNSRFILETLRHYNYQNIQQSY